MSALCSASPETLMKKQPDVFVTAHIPLCLAGILSKANWCSKTVEARESSDFCYKFKIFACFSHPGHSGCDILYDSIVVNYFPG